MVFPYIKEKKAKLPSTQTYIHLNIYTEKQNKKINCVVVLKLITFHIRKDARKKNERMESKKRLEKITLYEAKGEFNLLRAAQEIFSILFYIFAYVEYLYTNVVKTLLVFLIIIIWKASGAL